MKIVFITETSFLGNELVCVTKFWHFSENFDVALAVTWNRPTLSSSALDPMCLNSVLSRSTVMKKPVNLWGVIWAKREIPSRLTIMSICGDNLLSIMFKVLKSKLTVVGFAGNVANRIVEKFQSVAAIGRRFTRRWTFWCTIAFRCVCKNKSTACKEHNAQWFHVFYLHNIRTVSKSFEILLFFCTTQHDLIA